MPVALEANTSEQTDLSPAGTVGRIVQSINRNVANVLFFCRAPQLSPLLLQMGFWRVASAS